MAGRESEPHSKQTTGSNDVGVWFDDGDGRQLNIKMVPGGLHFEIRTKWSNTTFIVEKRFTSTFLRWAIDAVKDL